MEKLSELRYETQNKGLIRCLFALLELNRGESSEVRIDWPAVNIEHIQPQNPPNQDEIPVFEDYVHLLGNLTLITEKLNKKLGNKSPREKVKVLDTSKLQITRDISSLIEERGWSPSTIESRTTDINNELGEILLQPRKQ